MSTFGKSLWNTVENKTEHYHAGYQYGKDTIELYGLEEVQNMFNNQYPLGWKPSDASEWQYCKGFIDALT